MLRRFTNLEDAVMYVSEQREAGYFAEILHLHTGHLWGAVPSMGFSVLVSELSGSEDEIMPTEYEQCLEKSIFSKIVKVMLDSISFCFYWAVKLGLIFAALFTIYVLALNVYIQPIVVFKALTILFVSALLLMVVALGVQVYFDIYKRQNEIGYGLIRASVLLIAVVLMLILPLI